jgi:hypothetical protein
VTGPGDPAHGPRTTYRDEGRIALRHDEVRTVQEIDAESFLVNHWHVRGSWREFLAFYAGDVNRIYHFPPPGDGYVAEDLPAGPPAPVTESPPAGEGTIKRALLRFPPDSPAYPDPYR